jgi:hypothetical protein
MTRSYDSWKLASPTDDLPSIEDSRELSELEIEAEEYVEMSHDALVVEVLKLRIRLEAAHEEMGGLKWRLGELR